MEGGGEEMQRGEGVEEGGGRCREGMEERIIRGKEEGKRRGGRKGGEEERKE